MKVPLAEGAKQAILREADMLATLAEEKYDCAPRLLYLNRELGIATQTFIPGASGDRRFNVDAATFYAAWSCTMRLQPSLSLPAN